MVSCQAVPHDNFTENGEFYRTYIGLTTVPTDIPPEAIKVDLSDNSIHHLQASAFQHLNICIELKIDSKSLSTIENGTFNGLLSLEEPSLLNNDLIKLTTNMFEDLINCKRIFLSSNRIKVIEDDAFNGLNNLEQLYIANNDLAGVLDLPVFVSLTSLKVLDVSCDGQAEVKKITFKGLRRLQHLDLSYNKIYSIEDGAFENLKGLLNLGLEGNALTELISGMFLKLTSLDTITLHENNLTTIAEKAFSTLPRPLLLQLSNPAMATKDNPLHCDSRLCWLKQEEEFESIRYYYNLLSNGNLFLWHLSVKLGVAGMNWFVMELISVSDIVFTISLGDTVCQLSRQLVWLHRAATRCRCASL